MGGDKWSTAKPSADKESGKQASKKASSNPGFGGFSLEGHYAECYPGMAEEYDATYDSDEEADYTKMDMVGVARVGWLRMSECLWCRVTRKVQ